MNKTADKLKEFLASNGLSQASIARSIGVSSSRLSQYLRGIYPGDVDPIEAKIEAYITNYLDQSGAGNALDVAETTDLTMVQSTCEEIAVNRGMGAIYGQAGSGKTEAIKAFAAKHPEAVLIETMPMMTVKELLTAILEGLGQKNAQGTVANMINEAAKLFKKSERILLVDEAENLTTKSLEAIRRIHDFSRVPTVLVGTYALIQNLKGRQGELLQLYSRISDKWEMQGLNDEDRAQLFGDLGKHIKRYTSDFRRSANIYKKAQRLAALADETANAQHVAMASNTVILD